MRFFILLTAITAAVASLQVEQAYDIIRNSFSHQQLRQGAGGLCNSNTCCNITATQSCPLTAMPKDTSTLVLPGGNTRYCRIFSILLLLYILPPLTVFHELIFIFLNFLFLARFCRCIFSDSTPFAFQIIPGDSDKLLFYFQGGGACWDKASTAAGLCTTDVSPQELVGTFDR